MLEPGLGDLQPGHQRIRFALETVLAIPEGLTYAVRQVLLHKGNQAAKKHDRGDEGAEHHLQQVDLVPVEEVFEDLEQPNLGRRHCE